MLLDLLGQRVHELGEAASFLVSPDTGCAFPTPAVLDLGEVSKLVHEIVGGPSVSEAVWMERSELLQVEGIGGGLCEFCKILQRMREHFLVLVTALELQCSVQGSSHASMVW